MGTLDTLSAIESLLDRELMRQATQAGGPDEAVLFRLAKISCELEASKSLSATIAAAASSGAGAGAGAGVSSNLDLLQNLSFVHLTGTCRKVISSLTYVSGSLNPAKVDYEPLPISRVVTLGQVIAASGSVPEFQLDDAHTLIRDNFRKFADINIIPIAEKIHREDLLVPDELISKLGELGCFGLSIPEAYGGLQSETDPDSIGMVLVTEELSRGSLGAAGSLITRPEILARALLKGGTEEQKKKWLPVLASGEKMAAIAVTEPDYGSDVAGLRVSATPVENGWLISGTKTWCTFAGRANVLAVLARSSPDMALRHKGLSLFLIEKPTSSGHEFNFEQPGGGRLGGRAISTIGYRGMHSFEVKFDKWFVPAEALVGGEAGLGKGFYLQMEGFAAGRLQTAARANGLMHAALEKAISYANERSVFGKPISGQPASSQKIALMASALLASRALTQKAAINLDKSEGTLLAAMAKLYASNTAEWVTREAQQLHGGMGYAEEYAVSRFFVDARVLSIFEGAEEVLAVKIIAPALLARQTK